MSSALTHRLVSASTGTGTPAVADGFRPALRIVLIYLVLAGLWIGLSHRLLDTWIDNERLRGTLEVYKGWFFVGITAALLYRLLREEFRRQAAAVGAHHEADAARRETEARFREVVETINEGFWIADANGTQLLYVSPSFEAIWGRSAYELYQTPGGATPQIHPEDRERVQRAMAAKLAHGEYHETYRVLRPDGTQRWVEERAYPIRDDEHHIVRIVGVASDVTHNKTLEDQFLRAQRMEAIGMLAGGIAHDLNNILAPMLMVGPLLRDKLTNRDDAKLLDLLETCGHRGASVVRQLLAFSRGVGSGVRGALELRHLLREIEAIMRETFPREITSTVRVGDDVGLIVGDATQLHQVLMNLCVNARDAMPSGGSLVVAACTAKVEPEEARKHPGAKAGPHVKVSVSDSGEGIAPKDRSRIFDPFFTTKALGQGTGLGLSTVQGIVKAHGGFVTVESEVGRGSTFRVYLPAAEPAPGVEGPVSSAAGPTRGQGELVLVVDDEPTVLDTTRLVLETHGYAVLTASNGSEAIATYLAEAHRIRAVITDLMMPQMGGPALVRALRAFDCALPVIVATGLDAPDRDTLETLEVQAVVKKPCTSETLLDALAAQLIDQPPPSSAPAES